MITDQYAWSCQYRTCVQVPWVSSYLGSGDSLQMRITKYLGLLPAGVPLSMEALLRFKALVLIAVTVKRRSLRSLHNAFFPYQNSHVCSRSEDQMVGVSSRAWLSDWTLHTMRHVA